MSKSTVTFHGVLAGAYKGKNVNERALLTHASVDGGITALCKKVKADALCDMEEETVTCPTCIARVAKLPVLTLVGPVNLGS